MKRGTSIAVACLALLGLAVGTVPAGAQAPAQAPQGRGQATPPAALTYELAEQVIDAAEAEARKNKWNVSIVVVDANGVPVMVRRLNGASPRSYEIASRKAATVVATKLTTAQYAAQLKEGKVQEVPNGTAFAGGVPIVRGGEFIGAVGTSGVQAVQDEQVSLAGANTIK